MEELPPNVQVHILERANLPIDTYLHYRKLLGIKPKKLIIDPKTEELLIAIYKDRTDQYNRKIKLQRESGGRQSDFLVYFSKDIRAYDKYTKKCGKHIGIIIDHVGNKTKIAIRSSKKTHDEMWTIRKTVVDMHTGYETTDWLGDSDSDIDW
jgi:hypothetical protein